MNPQQLADLLVGIAKAQAAILSAVERADPRASPALQRTPSGLSRITVLSDALDSAAMGFGFGGVSLRRVHRQSLPEIRT